MILDGKLDRRTSVNASCIIGTGSDKHFGYPHSALECRHMQGCITLDTSCIDVRPIRDEKLDNGIVAVQRSQMQRRRLTWFDLHVHTSATSDEQLDNRGVTATSG